jgi:hypothetical protein
MMPIEIREPVRAWRRREMVLVSAIVVAISFSMQFMAQRRRVADPDGTSSMTTATGAFLPDQFLAPRKPGDGIGNRQKLALHFATARRA